jgi:hypothetical protein
LKREKLPITLFSSHDFYGVALGKKIHIKTSAHSSDHFVHRYREIFSDRWTTVQEIAQKLEATPRSIQLKLKAHARDFERMRDGNSRYYRLST